MGLFGQQVDFSKYRQADLTPEAPDVSTFFQQTWNDTVNVSNLDAHIVNYRDAFDAVNEKIKGATGEVLDNPMSADQGPIAAFQALPAFSRQAVSELSPVQAWSARIGELRQKHPDALDWDGIADEPHRTAWERMKAIREQTNEMSKAAGLAEGSDVPLIGSIPYVGPALGTIPAFLYNAVRHPLYAGAELTASFGAQMTSPLDATVNLLSFGAGGAAKSIVKNAALNASVNAAGQAILSAPKQISYRDAGLPWGFEQWANEVAGAAAAGFAIDAAVRGPSREILRRYGRDVAPGEMFSRNTERAGFFTDLPEDLNLPKAAKALESIDPEVFKRAQADDPKALRELAEKTGAIDDPAVKGAIEHIELGGSVDEAAAKFFRDSGIDPGEGMRTLGDAISGRYDYLRQPDPVPQATAPMMRAEAMDLLMKRGEDVEQVLGSVDQRIADQVRRGLEAGLPRVVAAVREALAGDIAKAPESLRKAIQKAADEFGGPDRLADLIAIHAGRDPIETARAMKRSPDLVDSNVRLDTDFMRGARSLSRLDDDAFAMLGQVPPGVAAAVSDLVPPGQHGRVMEDLRKGGIQSGAEARAAIPLLIDRARPDTPLHGGSKIDDPAGPEAKAQTERLMAEHADAVKEAMAPIKEREKIESKIEDIRGEIAKLEEKATEGPKMAALNEKRNIVRVYHGTNEDFITFDETKMGSRGASEEGAFFFGSRDLANEYADVQWTASPGDMKRAYEESLTPDGKFSPAKWAKLHEEVRQQVGSGRVIPADLDTTDFGTVNLTGYKWLSDEGERVKRAIDKAKREGKDGLIIKGMEDGTGIRETQYAVWGKGRVNNAMTGHLMYALADSEISKLAKLREDLHQAEADKVRLTAHIEQRPLTLAEHIIAAADYQRAKDVNRALFEALGFANRILPEGTQLELTPERMTLSGRTIDATSDMTTGAIRLGTYAADPGARIGHEGVHTLITLGHLSPEEVALLAKASREVGAFKQEAQYRDAYKDRPNLDTLIDEEAAAHYVEARIKSPEPKVQTILDRINALIERIRNALAGYGFKTAEDIRDAILRGDVARREAVQGWMRQEDVTAFAIADQRPFWQRVGSKGQVAEATKPENLGVEPPARSSLDMSDAARLDRARSMGFKTDRTLVRGDMFKIDAFDLDSLLDPAGVHFIEKEIAPNAESTARFFGDNVRQYYARGEFLDVRIPGKAASESFDGVMIPGLGGSDAYFFRKEDLASGAKQNGYTGLRVYDPDGTYIETVVFNPSDIRRTNAAFDPAHANSANLLYAFAGERAKTADLDALSLAKDMEAQGKDREAIWTDTGWFKGVDGKWRFEIDDSGAMIPFPTQEAITERGYAGSSALYAALKHPELLDAYPDLRRHSWSMNRADVIGGSYERYPEGRYNTGDIKVSGPTNSDRLSVMLHEAQHGVQANEGFAPGAGDNTFVQQSDAKLARDALSWRREMERHKGDWSARDNAVAEEYKTMGAPDFIPSVDARNVAMDMGSNPTKTLEEIVNLYGLDRKTTPFTPRQMYNRTAGEVEARTVQKRMDLTPDQRRARPPWLDYDVPEQDQIVRFADGQRQSDQASDGKMYAINDNEKRLKQAEDMGFDTSKVWYRGGKTDRAELKAMASEVKVPAIWFTNSADTASEFATLRARHANYADFKNDYSPSVLPAFTRGRFKTVEGFFRAPDFERMGKQMEKAKAEGYDGVVFKRINDKPGATGPSLFGSSDVLALFDGANARSVNAQFDPKKTDSANLLAALSENKTETFKGYHATANGDLFTMPLSDKYELSEEYGLVPWGSSSKRVADSYAEHRLDESPSVVPLEYRFERPLIVDAQGRRFGARTNALTINTDVLAARAREAGYDGLVIRNVRDGAGADQTLGDTYAPLRPGTTYSSMTGELMFALSDEPRPPLHADLAAVHRLESLKQLAEACAA